MDEKGFGIKMFATLPRCKVTAVWAVASKGICSISVECERTLSATKVCMAHTDAVPPALLHAYIDKVVMVLF